MIFAKTVRLLTGLGLVSILGVSSASALDEERLARFFALLDADGNGGVSRPEFQAGKGVVFLAIDEDGSMTITRNETRLTADGFKLLAGDDDIIDGQEFIAADVASFEVIDKDQDHTINPKELRDYVAKYSD